MHVHLAKEMKRWENDIHDPKETCKKIGAGE
jgi:hypothetical protein